MTITFPRTFLHDLPVVGLEFDLEPMAELTPTRSGKVIAKDIGPTLWRAVWRSGPLEADLFGEARAWRATLLSYEAFYGYDRLREYPLTYKDGWGNLTVGGSPFDGTGTLDSVDPDNKRITVSELPVGFKLVPGDYLAFDYGTDSRALHMVVAEATADGSGIITNMEVRPLVRTGWDTSPPPTVELYRAAAQFIIVPDTWAGPEEAPHFGRVSFEAVQTL